jgi:peptidoglycan-associated lipoprotein
VFESGKFGSRAEPFLGDSSGSTGSTGSRSGIDEARRQSFTASNSLKDIYFKFDKYDLDEESRSILRQNVSYLKSNSGAIIEIQGHCDERGTNNYNIALGERRARSTKMYLVSQGISSKRIHTISYGEERPLCLRSKSNYLPFNMLV